MKIESRFNLKEEVWYFNTKTFAIESGLISQVNYTEGISGYRDFSFCIGKKYYNVAENRCFYSKQELLNFLNNTTTSF